MSSDQREKNIEALLRLYRPPTRLRTSHKDLLKTIWSLQQRFDGSKVTCFYCKKTKDFEDITVHHNDGEETHNDPSNLSAACYVCNRKEGEMVRRRKKAQVIYRERENYGRTPDSTPIEHIIREEERPRVIFWTIQQILKGWELYTALTKRKEKDIASVDVDEIREVAARLKYRNIVGGAAKQCNVAKQTVYNWLAVEANEINGFLRVREMPEGKLLDFAKPEDHKLPDREIFRREVPPNRKRKKPGAEI